MYRLLSILLFALLFAVNIEDEIREGKHNLKNLLISRAELELDSDIAVHGIQFDIKYNPLEVKSVTPLQINGYEVTYPTISDSLIRGLIFSKEGKELLAIV